MAAGNQAVLISTATLSQMTDLVRREWKVVKEKLTRDAKQLYNVEMIGAGQGSSKRYNEYDTETFADRKLEGANSSKSRIGVGYEKDMVARSFSKEIDITWEMRVQNRSKQVGQMITDLAGFCENRQDLDLTHRLTFATSTSYTDMNGDTVATTMGDGYALAYSAHLLAFSSITYRNRVVGDPAFSQGGLEAASLLGSTETYNNFGERRTMDFNTIVTGTDEGTVRTVRQLLNSTADIDAAQSGIVNVYKSKYRHVILPYLASTATGAYDSTKRRWWFLIASGMNGWQAYLGEWVAPELLTPSTGNNLEDGHNFNWTFATRCMYGVVVLSGRGLIASCPTS